MLRQLLFSFLFLASVSNFYSQTNSTCANPQPFCTGQTMQFPAGVNSGNAQAGPNYGCLGSQPNPAWFYFQMGTSGPVSISMSAANDIDFICWGPFPTLNGNCGNLTAGNTVDCSYSGSATETCVIANAVAGQFYLLLITNFSNANQPITFTQNNANTPGAGQTNCGVLCSMTVAATSSLCAGQTGTLSVTTGTSIVSVAWNGPGGFNSSSFTPNIPNMTVGGSFTCIGTTTGTNPATNTCAVTASINVVQNPTTTAANNGPICAGATASLTGGGATTYAWLGPGGFISNIANPSIPGAQPVNAGVYTVLGSAGGCTSTASTTLQVNANPTVTAANSGSYCAGQSFNLTAGGAASYTWSGPNGYSSNVPNPNFNNIAPNLSGTYNLIGATGGCTATASTALVVNPLPAIVAVTSGNVCENFSVTLSAIGGTSFVWTGPNGFVSFQQNPQIVSAIPANTGVYTVVGTNMNGCVNSATVAEVVFAKPIITVLGSNACMNDQLMPTVNGGSTYQWTGPNGFSSAQQNPIINNVSLANAGAYNVTVTSAAGCVSNGTVFCNVYNKPVVNFTGNTEACKGDLFSFSGSGAISYKWLGTFGIAALGPQFSISSVSNSLQTTYTLVGSDGNGCFNSVVITPIVLGLPYGTVSSDKAGGCVPFCTKFNFQKGSPIITNVNWSFSNGNTFADSSNVTQCFTTAGTHTVNINLVDSKGCKGKSTATVEGYPIPHAEFSYTPDSPNENDNTVTFTDETGNASIVNWFWDFYSTGKDTSNKSNPTYTFPEIGNYFVYMKVTSNHGCVDSIVKKLTVVEDVTFFIPNSFTPNGDGNNEVFLPKAVGIKKYRMDIFDRWGQLVYTTTDILQGWDGKSKKGGDILPQDVYVYKISVSNSNSSKPKTYTGHVTLMK
ncbi:MAG: gliding motility-associated C-terminal domain-containing protein [Bacteroidetes bacterium]|nr:gliding motility-associated C-terminal domain-containing protein [Bacteroidota bacterium]